MDKSKVKTLPCEAKAMNQQQPETLLWARGRRRWTDAKFKKKKSVLWSDESTFQIGFGNHGPCELRPKEGKGPFRLLPVQSSKASACDGMGRCDCSMPDN